MVITRLCDSFRRDRTLSLKGNFNIWKLYLDKPDTRKTETEKTVPCFGAELNLPEANSVLENVNIILL